MTRLLTLLNRKDWRYESSLKSVGHNLVSSPLRCFRVAPVLELMRNLSLGVSLQDDQAELRGEPAAKGCVSGYLALVQDVHCCCLLWDLWGGSPWQGVESGFWNEDADFSRVNWKKEVRIEDTVVEEEDSEELLLEDIPPPSGIFF